MKSFLPPFFFLLSILQANAQENLVSSKLKFYAGLSFTSVPTLNIVSTDTSYNNSLSIEPFLSLEYNGYSAVYSPKFIGGKSSPGIYMHAITLRYSQYDKRTIDFLFESTHMFFTNNKSIPYTPLNNEINSEIIIKKMWIRPEFAIGAGFGNKNQTITSASGSAFDCGVSAGINHSFNWDNGEMNYTVAPSFLLNGGTNNYFSFLEISKYIGHNQKFGNYTKRGVGAKRRNRKRSTSTSDNSFSLNSFSLNNIGCNLETSAEIGSLSIRPTFDLFIPVGTAAGTGLSTFWQLALEYKF
jgi:hypothetical protein